MRDLLAPHRPGRTPADAGGRRAGTRRIAGRLALAVALALLTLAVLASAAGAGPATPQVPASVAGVPLAAGNTVFQFGKDAVVPKGETVENAISVGGNVIVRGTTNVAVAVGGDIRVTGTVRKTCVAVGGDVRLGSNASVGLAQNNAKDTSVVTVGGDLIRQPGAQVRGDVSSVHGAWIGNALGAVNPFRPGSIFGWFIWTAVAIVLAVIAVAVAPRQLTSIAETMHKRPLGSLGWGALTALVMIPISLVILTITVIGLLVVIPWVLFTPFLIVFSYLCMGIAVGLLIFRGSQSRANLYLTATVGVLIVCVVRLIPVAGFIATGLGTILAFGAIVLTVADWQRRRRDLRRAAMAASYGGPGGPVPPGGPYPLSGPVPPGGSLPAGPAPSGGPMPQTGPAPGGPMTGGPYSGAGYGQAQPAWTPPAGQAPGQPGPWIVAPDAAAQGQPAQWAPAPAPQPAPWEPLPVPPQSSPQPQQPAAQTGAAVLDQTLASPPQPAVDAEATQIAPAPADEVTQAAPQPSEAEAPQPVPQAAPEAPAAPAAPSPETAAEAEPQDGAPERSQEDKSS